MIDVNSGPRWYVPSRGASERSFGGSGEPKGGVSHLSFIFEGVHREVTDRLCPSLRSPSCLFVGRPTDWWTCRSAGCYFPWAPSPAPPLPPLGITPRTCLSGVSAGSPLSVLFSNQRRQRNRGTGRGTEETPRVPRSLSPTCPLCPTTTRRTSALVP